MELDRRGEGERPFLALHGWGADRGAFDPLEPHRPPSVSLWRANLPGCGGSPPPPEWRLPVVVETIAATVRGLAERAGRPLTLVGTCSGGNLAAFAALAAPEAVERLVLLDLFAKMPGYFRLFLAGDFGRIAYHTTFASPLGRRLTNAALASRRTGETDLTASFAAADHAATLEYLRLLGAVDGPEVFSPLELPIDLLHGERTFGAVRRSLPAWRRVWPQAVIHEVAGAGHLPLAEAPAAVAAIAFGDGGAR